MNDPDRTSESGHLADLEVPAAVDVALEVGASAANQGAPLHEVIDLVERGYNGAPVHETVRAACLAWAETMSERLHDVTCEDELTTLVTPTHLRTRLGDLYREAATDGRLPTEHVLVVVELAEGRTVNDLERSLHALEVGQSLRTVFPGEEVLTRLTQDRFAALARRDRTDPTTLALIGLVIARTSAGHPEPRLWVEELPRDVAELGRWIASLTRR